MKSYTDYRRKLKFQFDGDWFIKTAWFQFELKSISSLYIEYKLTMLDSLSMKSLSRRNKYSKLFLVDEQ